MQKSASELTNRMVRAGAGAGKTTNLINEVVTTFSSFKAQHGRAPRIIVTTFTRKATQELKERLLIKACEMGSADLIEYMSDGTKLHISTIHGLLSLFLRQIAHLTEMDPGFQVMEEGASHLMKMQVLREIFLKDPSALVWLDRHSYEDLLKLCSDWSQARAEYPELIPFTVEHLRKSAIEKSNKVREWLVELASTVLEEMDHPKWVEWGHSVRGLSESWAGQLYNLELGRKPNKVNGFEDFEERIGRILTRVKNITKEECWNEVHWPEMVELWGKFQSLAQIFEIQLRARKLQSGMMDMPDLELRSLEILRDKPFLAETFSSQWDIWLIDEFQDTSQIQFEILTQLRGNKPAYYVGDPQQSIYLFRDARPEIFTEQWQGKSASEREELKTNWRSEPPLLHFINDVVKDLGPAFQAMQPNPKFDIKPEPIAATIVRANSPDVERSQAVSEILKLVEGGARFEQICILGRKHSHLMALATLLKARGLPTHVHSPAGFWSRRETQDAQALWRFLTNPHDNVNLIQLLRTPYLYLPDAEIADLMKTRPRSLWRKISSLEKVNDSLALLKQAQMISEEIGLVAALEWALMESGIFDLALQNDPAGRKESNLWKFLMKVKELEREGGAGFLTLESDVQDIDSHTEGDAATSQEPNCINLMTIHGAKGLEFDYVIIPHMGDDTRKTHTPKFFAMDGGFSFAAMEDDEGKSIPSPMEKIWVENRREKEKEENLRLLYVAVTRAKKRLWLSASEIAQDSWADLLTVFRQPEGISQTPNYSIEVKVVTESPTDSILLLTEAIQVREPFQASSQSPSKLRRSVTEMLGKDDSNVAPPQVVFNIAKKKSEGVHVHRVLEALRYGVEEIAEGDGKLKEAVDFVRNLLTPPMAQVLEAGEAEWGFQVQTPGGLLEGQIDLWGQVGDTLWIVDYKSGSEKFKDKAFEQLSLYAWALRQFSHTAKIKLAVVYPLSQKSEVRDFSESSGLHWEQKFRLTE